MKLAENIGNFDLGRLTLVGWLVLLTSFAAGPIAMMWLSPFNSSTPLQGRRKLEGVIGVGVAIATFFVLKFLLGLLGLTVVRPPRKPPTDQEATPSESAAAPQ